MFWGVECSAENLVCFLFSRDKDIEPVFRRLHGDVSKAMFLEHLGSILLSPHRAQPRPSEIHRHRCAVEHADDVTINGSGIPHVFVRRAVDVDFHHEQETAIDHHPSRLPEDALRVGHVVERIEASDELECVGPGVRERGHVLNHELAVGETESCGLGACLCDGLLGDVKPVEGASGEALCHQHCSMALTTPKIQH